MSIDPPVGDRRDERRSIPSEVIAASRSKFLYFGVHRTTMADISREVGIPRQALYEYVSSRDDLVQAVLIQRIHEIAEEVKPFEQDSFANALLETSVAAIHTARNDKELMNLVATAPKLVQKVVVGRCPEIHDIVRRLFDPILERGARAGQLRTDKSRDEIIDWFRIVFLALITQTDFGPDAERSIIAGFLLPSVMFSL
jgi:AcrR family transcriptional regulator